jgi:CxxC motif-containing protein (DUF1111 family)
MLRRVAFISTLIIGLGTGSAQAVDPHLPFLVLNDQDVWVEGEGNYAAEYNRWVWLNFSAPVTVETYDTAALAGGEGTTFASSREAYSIPLPNLDPDRIRDFAFARQLFRRHWFEAPSQVENLDGLGPTFNRTRCSGCHVKDGRGRPPANPDEPMKSMLMRLSVPGMADNGGPLPHPVYGGQLQNLGAEGVPGEGRARVTYREIEGTFADGQTYRLREPVYEFTDLSHGPMGDDVLFSPRVAPALHGLGLLEAIDTIAIEAAADPDDADGDGISGKVNRVWDPIAGEMRLGRFGWKANTASLDAQVAGAAFGDMGLTSSLFPADNCPPAQEACRAAANGDSPEIDDVRIEKLALYSRALSVPARRDLDDPAVQNGEALFVAAGCGGCHTPAMTTGEEAELHELTNQQIQPFTDLLLHDMGEELADGRPDFDANGREWRTPPLWGIGLMQSVSLHNNLLHDGRARGFMEAILWHGGEGEASRQAVIAMPNEDRAALVTFLRSL